MGKPLESAVSAGLGFLRKAQSGGGGFSTLSSDDSEHFANSRTYSTTFAPALILAALGQIKSPESVKIREELAGWLARQKSPHGSYNYWAADAPERKTLPYPDDLDDTSCALIGLYEHDPSLIDGATLAQIVKLLIATEAMPGGPYRTWLVPKTSKKGWLDIDLAVNANIAGLLSRIAEPLPNLNGLMEKAIAAKKFHSPYYPDEYPVLYYISRAYDGQKRPELAKYIMSLRRKDGSWGTPMQTALAVSSLVRLGSHADLDTAMKYLVRTQRDDGSWPEEAFCLDPAIERRKYYSGSAALSTAFALEALELLDSRAQRLDNNSVAEDKRRDSVYKKVVVSATGIYKGIDRELHGNAATLLDEFAAKDTGKDAILLPYLFYASLKKPGKYHEQFYVSLGLANMFGWLAYTIYDDFLDDEGDVKLLNAANVAMRQSLAYFRRCGNEDYFEFVSNVFNTIDTANNWEVTNCRFKVDGNRITLGKLPEWGNLDKLADRSAGHALTPLAILEKHGYKLDSSEAKHVYTAIRHFLIARQLNDDLHDWQEDLDRGHITYVVAEILKGIGTRKTLDLKHSLPTLQKQFWHHTVLDICQDITHHTAASRAALASCKSLKGTNVLTLLLDNVDKINAETQTTVNDAKNFLKAYSKKR